MVKTWVSILALLPTSCVALALCLFPQLQKIKYPPHRAVKNKGVSEHEAFRTEKMLSGSC